MGLKLAVAGSNLSHQYGLPAFFVALAVDSTSALSIPSLHVEQTKAKQVRGGGQDPFDLSNFEEGLFTFGKLILVSKVLSVERSRSDSQDTFSKSILAYNSVLDALLSELQKDVRTSGQPIENCLLKLPINRESIEMTEDSARAKFQSSFYSFTTQFRGRGSDDSVLGLARLFARYEYSKIRRTSQLFVNSVVRNNEDSVFQILRLTWNSPPLDTYPDNFVGYPRLFFRKNRVVESRTLRIGDEIAIVPIARYCVGPSAAIDEPIATCLCSSSRRPFGYFMEGNGFDRCPKCGGENDPLRIVQRLHNGQHVLDSIEPGLSERILLGNYSIYVAKFGKKLKVGRTMHSRTIPRLLEQGASSALIFYPIETLQTAATVENKLTQYLGNEFGTEDMSVTGGISREAKLSHMSNAISPSERSDAQDLYFKAIQLIEAAHDPEVGFLSMVERRVIDLTKNWVLPGPVSDYEFFEEPQFRAIRGKICGFVGSFLLIDDKIVDTDLLSGYVVEDIGTKTNQS
jgi:hypothetical protein